MPSAVASDTTRAALLFHALSDEIRIEVIRLLQSGERCVCELMEELDMAQSKLSWHLKTLSDAGIITGRREGRWNYYSLHPDAFTEAKAIVDSLRPSARRLTVRSSSDCC